MIVVLTGGTGLVGKALGKKLCKLGYTIHILTRSPNKQIDYPCKKFIWHASERPPLESFPPNEDWGVVHLAGESISSWPWTPRKKKAIYESRVLGTKHLVSALKEVSNPPKFFISASALGIYPNQKNKTYTELSPLNESSSLFLEKTCKDWEKEILKHSRSRILILRFGLILSHLGGGLVPYLKVARKKLSFWSFKPSWMNWIHIQDVVNIIVWTIQNPNSSGVYNVTSPQPVTLNSFSKHLQKSLGNKFFLPFPIFLVNIFGGEMAKNLLTHSKILPEKLKKENYSFSYPSLKEALSDII